MNKPTHIQTASGIKFYPFKPSQKEICIEDIAHALSQQCRFSGHTSFMGKMRHYSVAQHSLYCSYICEEYPLWALLHDAAEVYLVDVPTPIKYRLPLFRELEDKIERTIANRFNLIWPRPSEVKQADIAAFEIEWVLLMEGKINSKEHKECLKNTLFLQILSMSMEEIKTAFINRFKELTR